MDSNRKFNDFRELLKQEITRMLQITINVTPCRNIEKAEHPQKLSTHGKS